MARPVILISQGPSMQPINAYALVDPRRLYHYKKVKIMVSILTNVWETLGAFCYLYAAPVRPLALLSAIFLKDRSSIM